MSTDWRTMEAGRELDRVIAERLGWTDIKLFDHDEMVGVAPLEIRAQLASPHVPMYSTSVDAALTLVDGTHGHVVDIQHMMFNPGNNPDYNMWVAHYYEDRNKWYEGRGETLALAICRAWLARMKAN